ncbi:MAG: protein phosphatase CheZ [Alphaproteobacteria bacterium]
MTRKLFSAERRLLSQGTERDDTGPTIADILAAVAALREDVRAIGAVAATTAFVTPPSPPSPQPAAVEDVKGPERNREVMHLRSELQALVNSIHQTKVEIATLRPTTSEVDRLTVVSNELDAVVSATETATQIILDSAEHVDTAATAIQSLSSDPAVSRLVDEIKEHVIAIFEACNFQDITGQRITKVVNTLLFIEERVEAMIDIWGRDSFQELPPPEDEGLLDEDAKLLNGPQLGAISQDDIDRLFG